MERIATAQAAALQKVSAALAGTGADPAAYLIAQRYIDTLRDITSGKDNKVIYLPYEATGLLGALGGIKGLFGNEHAPSPTRPRPPVLPENQA